MQNQSTYYVIGLEYRVLEWQFSVMYSQSAYTPLYMCTPIIVCTQRVLPAHGVQATLSVYNVYCVREVLTNCTQLTIFVRRQLSVYARLLLLPLPLPLPMRLAPLPCLE